MIRERKLVGMVVPRYAPAIGGIERHVEMLARGLTRRGLDIEVITTDPTGQLPPIETLDGVLVRRFPTIHRDSVYFVAPGLSVWLLQNAHRFEMLHAHCYASALPAQVAAISLLRKVPFVMSTYYHGTGHSLVRRALHIPYRPIGGWALHRASRVLCVSGAERELLQKDFGPRISTIVVPCGIDPGELLAVSPPARSASEVLVLATARLDHYKQVDRLVAAVPHLPRQYSVVVVGDGPARPQIERLVERLGVCDRVRLLGHVSRDRLLALYRSANVFVSMSRHESFGLTVLEAAVAGAAVVASDIAAHAEVAGYVPSGRVSLVAPDCTPSDLARAISSSAGLERPTSIADWQLPTWEQTASGTMASYRAVLDEGRAAKAQASSRG